MVTLKLVEKSGTDPTLPVSQLPVLIRTRLVGAFIKAANSFTVEDYGLNETYSAKEFCLQCIAHARSHGSDTENPSLWSSYLNKFREKHPEQYENVMEIVFMDLEISNRDDFSELMLALRGEQ